MKHLVLSALFLFPILASAAATPAFRATYTCDGRELSPGDQGQRGTVVVQVATEGKYVNAPWTLEVSWADALAPLVGAGRVCDVPVTGRCYGYGKVDGETVSVGEDCGVTGFDTRGLPHHEADARFVFSAGHGRVYCAHHDKGAYANIELTNCR